MKANTEKTSGVPKIQATRNYEMFNPNPLFQRKYNPNRVKLLERSMTRDGYWKAEPISVFRKNSKLYINTGHHRLDAAKAAGVAIYYIVEEEWPAERMVSEGAVETQASWSGMDAAKAYAMAGISDYDELLRFARSGIPVNMAASMLMGEAAGSGNAAQLVKEGRFRVKITAHIVRVIGLIQQTEQSNPEVKSRAFIAALSSCLFVREFDAEKLESKLKKHPRALEKRSTKDQMLDQIEELYNFHSRDKVNIAFLARESAKSRNRCGLKR